MGPYLDRMKEGTLNAQAKPRIVSETPGVALWDGDNGLGHIVGYHVMKDAIEKTKRNGIGTFTAVVRNSHHYGAAGYFSLMAAEQDLLALSMSNTGPVVAVPGGRSRVLGNGPFSWAAPATDAFGPMVFDVAWSTTAGSRVILYMRRGEQLPEGWMIDGEGKPTTDPNSLMQGGAMTTAAAHKGYGMALMVELLTAVLGGGTLARDTTHFGVSHMFYVIDPAVFGPLDEFKARLAETTRDLHDSPKAVGADRILVPGELELEHEADSLANGLEFPPELWDEIVNIAEKYGTSDELEQTRI
jgi:LDH2 family malate/lactate/ureidoglycolate dehydrogenase